MNTKMKKIPIYTRHHILPRHPFWNDNPRNIITIKDTTHRAIHTLFENKLIAEQLLKTIDYSEKAMKPEIVALLKEVLTMIDPSDPTKRYIDDVIL